MSEADIPSRPAARSGRDDLYAVDAADQVQRWDAGQTIWTLEMGGLGPGYEQTIQIAAVEFSRVCKDLSGLKNDDAASTDAFTKACEGRLHEIDDLLGGMSGAQFGVARWLAWQWVVNGGPRALITRAKERGEQERVIQCSRAFPTPPPAPRKEVL